MTGEICMFNKYGFCKNGDKCNRSHLQEVCLKRECDSRKCDKRHPRPCKLMMENGFCKFGTKCSYSHRLPKTIEDQNIKIEALERMIESQNETINYLKVKMLENHRRELDHLQSQINLLKSQNSAKENLIKKLDNQTALIELKEDEDESTLQESSEYKTVPNHSPVPTPASVKLNNFVRNSLKHLEEMECIVKKGRKMSIIRDKYKLHCDKIEDEYQKNEIRSEIYNMAIKGLKHYLETPVEESDKDDYLKCIFKCRALLQS